MRICGVISEFNPFHNGHKYLLDEIHSNGFDAVVCVMSGNFVQRGDISLIDKKNRASVACQNGADLVLSLPFPWSCAGAEYFARAGVNILDSLGCVEYIGFGSECGDVSLVEKCSECLSAIPRNDILSAQKMEPDVSYAQMRYKLVAERFGTDAAEVLQRPNDILGVEYLNAIKFLNSRIRPIAFTRIGAMHNDCNSSDVYSSSSWIREQILSNNLNVVSRYIPDTFDFNPDLCRRIDIKAYYNFLRGAVLSREPNELVQFAEVSGGFEYAIYKGILLHDDYYSFFDSLRSRHLTDAKIRRALLFVSLGIKKNHIKYLPEFTEVLACNDVGKKILAMARKRASICIVSKSANIKFGSDTAKEQFKIQRKSELAFNTLYHYCD